MPQDILADGFVSLCIDTSLNFYDGKCRVLVEGQYVVNGSLAVPIVPDVPIHIPSTRFIDDMFTAGSVLAEGLKQMFCICPSNVDIYALPRLDAATGISNFNAGTVYTAGQQMVYTDGYVYQAVTTTIAGDTPVSAAAKWTQLYLKGVKAVYTMTVAGPATSDGQIDIFLGDRTYSVDRVLVTSGDTATAIATAIEAAIPASFPYVVTRSGAVITMTAKSAGTVGNFLNPVVNWKAFQNYFPTGVTITTVQATPGAGDPQPIDYKAALGTCCYSCYALLGGSTKWQRGMRDWIRSAWDCTKPQCFGHGYTYNSGSLGQVLAVGDNSAEFSRLAVPVNDVNFPWAMVAAYAALSCCTACVNPELSIQGRNYGVLNCIERPTSCSLPWSFDEMTQLKDAGFVTYGPLTGGVGTLTSPYVVNDVTNNLYDDLNRPNVTFRDASSRRMAAKTSLELATKLNEFNGLANYTKNTQVPQGIFGTNKRMMEASIKHWAQGQVGIRFSEFDNMETDIVLREDFEVAQPCQGVPCKYHLFFRYRPPCRIANVQVQMLPKVLDNCAR